MNPLNLKIQIPKMNKLFFIFCVLSFHAVSVAQTGMKLPEPDKSSMDMSYYPNNYPILKIQNKITEPLAARIIYSRPLKQGRTIFGDLVEYGKIWRLGANEATELEFFKDVKINGKKILKGHYTLYALVDETSWTLILNKDLYVWGAFKYDSNKDVIRVNVPVKKTEESTEALSMMFEKSANGFNLVIAWEQIRVSLPVNL